MTGGLLCLAVFTVLAYNESPSLQRVMTARDVSFRMKLFLGAAAIAFLICIYQGTQTMLGWMPDSWGNHDEDGEYVTLAHSVSITLTALIGVMLIQIIGNAADYARRNKLLLEEIEELRERLRHVRL
jgi:hypothetical protein